MALSVMLDATAKDTIVTYKSNIAGSLPIVISATGVEDWVALDDATGADLEVGTDGTYVGSVTPVVISGRMTLLPTAPALSQLIQLTDQQYNTGIIINGTLNLTNPAGLWTVVYTNFLWTFKFKGYELSKKVKDVSLSFKCAPPNSVNLADIATAGGAIAGLL